MRAVVLVLALLSTGDAFAPSRGGINQRASVSMGMSGGASRREAFGIVGVGIASAALTATPAFAASKASVKPPNKVLSGANAAQGYTIASVSFEVDSYDKYREAIQSIYFTTDPKSKKKSLDQKIFSADEGVIRQIIGKSVDAKARVVCVSSSDCGEPPAHPPPCLSSDQPSLRARLALRSAAPQGQGDGALAARLQERGARPRDALLGPQVGVLDGLRRAQGARRGRQPQDAPHELPLADALPRRAARAAGPAQAGQRRRRRTGGSRRAVFLRLSSR